MPFVAHASLAQYMHRNLGLKQVLAISNPTWQRFESQQFQITLNIFGGKIFLPPKENWANFPSEGKFPSEG